MKKRPLWFYVVAVVVVLVILNLIFWQVGGGVKLREVESVSAGILIGMLAMYIAVHFYTWK